MRASRKVIKGLFGLLPVLASMLQMDGLAQDSWWNRSWEYRRKLTFDTAAISEDLTNFPVLVVLNSTNFNFSHAQTNGADIRFIDADGTNTLKHEIEKCDAMGSNAWIWVRVPKIDKQSDTDFIYIYYGASGASDGQDVENVWDTGYVGVWHLGESGNGAAGEFKDSTSNNNDGQGGAGDIVKTPFQTNGMIGMAQQFGVRYAGTGTHIRVPDSSSLDVSNATISGWATSGASGGIRPMMVKSTDMNARPCWYCSRLANSKDINFTITYSTNATPVWDGVTASNVVIDGQWFHFAFTMNASSNTEIYIDGVKKTNATLTASMSDLINSNPFNIGNGIPGSTVYMWPWKLDEIRISNVARSTDWIKACYNNQNSLSTFYGVGEEEKYHPSGTVISVHAQ